MGLDVIDAGKVVMQDESGRNLVWKLRSRLPRNIIMSKLDGEIDV